MLFAARCFAALKWHFCPRDYQRHVLLLLEASEPGVLVPPLSGDGEHTGDALQLKITYYLSNIQRD
jgi:hypothetical protein